MPTVARGPPVHADLANTYLKEISAMAVGFQKISVNLSDQVLEALREMAASEAVTLTEMLRRAISTHKFVEEAQHAGKQIYVRNPTTNELERIVFR